MKKITFILLPGLISIFLFAAVSEIILRLGIIENPLFERRQIRGKVNHHRYKLLVIGDSFIVPKGLLGRLLSRDLGSFDVAVLNAATSGTGPFEYLEEMKTVGTEFKPDVVLLSYYVGNDLTNVQNHPKFNLSEKEIAALASPSIAVRVDPFSAVSICITICCESVRRFDDSSLTIKRWRRPASLVI